MESMGTPNRQFPLFPNNINNDGGIKKWIMASRVGIYIIIYVNLWHSAQRPMYYA
jgi:hypothetical protein